MNKFITKTAIFYYIIYVGICIGAVRNASGQAQTLTKITNIKFYKNG